MEWYFKDKNLLEEYESGFQIRLVLGTWERPADIAPVIPKNINAIEQVHLLRQGLKYAQENEYAGNKVTA